MNTLLLAPAAKKGIVWDICRGVKIPPCSVWIFLKLHLLEITKKQPVFQPLGWDCSRWDGIVSGHWEVRIGQHNPGHGLLLLQRGRAQGPRASQMDFNVNAFKKTTVKAHYF